MKCKMGLEVIPCSSAAGWYMGTLDGEDGAPNCRLTSCYAATRGKATKLPLDRQNALENQFCNGNGNCFSVYQRAKKVD